MNGGVLLNAEIMAVEAHFGCPQYKWIVASCKRIAENKYCNLQFDDPRVKGREKRGLTEVWNDVATPIQNIGQEGFGKIPGKNK